MDADVRLVVLGFATGRITNRGETSGLEVLASRSATGRCCATISSPPTARFPIAFENLSRPCARTFKPPPNTGRPSTKVSRASYLLSALNRLTGNFLNALARRERIRLDEMELFLPEDLVKARVRAPDGSFKTIETGSVGEKSTAILSLLLSAGEQPIIIDQPEDDLDNQYVYNVVVDLLRRRKFSRQVIIATHNANIPVNGDAELILALGVEDRLGVVLGHGSIDQPNIKDLVSVIMEGSAEAFRLRRERYGY